jgi:hypothetical protein
MVSGKYFERISFNMRTGMHCRPQAEDMRRKRNEPVVLVNGFMIYCYTYGHIAKLTQ